VKKYLMYMQYIKNKDYFKWDELYRKIIVRRKERVRKYSRKT